MLDPQPGFFACWVGWAARRAPWVVACALIVTALSLYYSATHLRIDTDRDKMISPSLPFKLEEARVEALFPQLADNLVVVIDASTPEEARAAALELAEEVRSQAELFTGVSVPRADPFLERHGLLFLETEALAELSDRLAEVQPFLGRLAGDPSLRGLFGLLSAAYVERAEGRDAPLGDTPTRLAEVAAAQRAGRPALLSWQELLSTGAPDAEARRQYVLTKPRLDYSRLFPARPAIDELRLLGARLEGERGLRVRLTGGLAMAHEELESVMRGMEWIGALVFALVGAVLFAALRSWRLVLAVVAALVVGLSITAAFAFAAVGHLNLISVVFAALYLGLGVDYAIHLCLRYRELEAGGAEPRGAIEGAARDIGGSLALCALTTALGFYAFVPTAYSGVSELGLISGTGMFVSLVTTLTLLPALLVLLRVRTAPSRSAGPLRQAGGWLDFPVVHGRSMRWLSIVLAIAGLSSLAWLRFDPNPLRLRDAHSESVSTFRDLLESSSTPPWSLTAIAEDQEEERAVREQLSGLPGVARVVSVSSFVPRAQDEKLELLEETAFLLGGDLVVDQDAVAPTDAEREAAARALVAALQAWQASPAGADDPGAASLLDELRARLDGGGEWSELEVALLGTLPQNLERLGASLEAGEVRPASLPQSLSSRWVAPDGARRVELFSAYDLDDVETMRAFVDEVRAVLPNVSGPPRTILASGDAVVSAFRLALGLALVAIGVVVVALLRSWRATLLVLAPLLFAGLLTGGTLTGLGIPFDFANVIALPLLLGIGVDSAIHVVHRARAGQVVNPLRTSTARAVLYSGLTTLVSFVSLSLSSHPGTARMGVALTVGVAWTLCATLVFLPGWLVWWRGGARHPNAAGSRYE